ncbi:nitrous oxide-stimulated promoter family protein [Endozoicomonas sp. Mp262]|uniref:nitrous oxide-stimulated promoter family protein n=1 Tax=Endozoicomonas sp. Mp262 TaxID=2919499 RepID=UPI0021DB4BAA
MRKLTEPLTGALLYEHRTIIAMTHIYCAHHHKQAQKTGPLCDDCGEFIDFAGFRLSKCPYGQAKPVCQHCPIHCYKKDMKEKARIIMRYGGPRMLLKHPIMAIRHLWHARKPVPELPKKRKRAH